MKEFMKKPKARAALWMADCAMYMLFAELLRHWGIQLGGGVRPADRDVLRGRVLFLRPGV